MDMDVEEETTGSFHRFSNGEHIMSSIAFASHAQSVNAVLNLKIHIARYYFLDIFNAAPVAADSDQAEKTARSQEDHSQEVSSDVTSASEGDDDSEVTLTPLELRLLREFRRMW